MNAFVRHGLAVACLSLCLSCQMAAAQQDPLDDQDTTAYKYPVVITPTRLKQSIADVPGSVTIITGDTLRRYGVQNIADALRLVPGMAVTHATGNDDRITYHGTSVVAPRRMNVLVDGMPAYGTTLSRVDWQALPVAMEDIERIEVSRGPDSAAYGPNSMLAVVNIISRDPRDMRAGALAAGVGSHHTADATARVSTRLGEATHIALTADAARNSGYDHISLAGGDHDSSRVRRGNLRTRTDFSASTSLELFLNHAETFKQVATAGDPNQQSYPDLMQRSTNLAGRWTTALSSSHELQVRALSTSTSTRQDWATRAYALMLNPKVVELVNAHPEIAAAVAHGALSKLDSPDPADIELARRLAEQLTFQELQSLNAAINELGGQSNLAQTLNGVTNNNMDESRSQIEVQDTLVLSDQLRLVSGAGWRQQRAVSDTLLGGGVNSAVRWVFAHGEYRALPSLTINAGGYHEWNSLSGNSFSPRAAANYHLSDNQTIRAVYSRGSRSPDALEVRGNWAPTVENQSPQLNGVGTRTFALLRGNPDLTEERNTSLELGHVLAVRSLGMVIDSRVFKDTLTNLITNYSTFTQLMPNNDTSLKLAGAETQLSWDQGGDWSGWLHYAYLVNYEASNQVEQTQWSRHSGGVGIAYRVNDRWQTALSTVQSSADGFRQSSYGRTDLTLTHRLRADGNEIATSLTASYLNDPSLTTYLGAASGSFQSSYNDRLGLHAKIRIGF